MSNLKPYRVVSDFDIVNGLFTLNTATGARGTPVVIDGSGVTNAASVVRAAMNLAPTSFQPNVYSPRWEIRSKVRAAVEGEKPFGVTLFDTLEVNQWSYPLLYDKKRREESQAVLSGQAVPILQKGTLTVLMPTGEVPVGGKYAIVKGTGDWGVTAVSTGASGIGNPAIFGQYLGPKDNDGYAIVTINCYA